MLDRFWDGVNAGIKYALRSPDEAEKYKDDIQALRNQTEAAEKMILRINDIIKNAFSGRKNKNDE